MTGRWWRQLNIPTLLGLALAMVLASFALYHESLESPFVLDDTKKIESNPDLRSPEPTFSTFIRNYDEIKTRMANDPSRPLTFFLYWICWQIGEGDAVPFHVMNILIHALASLFAGALCARLVGRFSGSEPSPFVALLAGALFLVSPINGGTAIYAYGLSDILVSFFALWILSLVAKWEKPEWPKLLALGALYFLALASKQNAVVIAGLAVIVSPRQFRSHVLLFAMALAYLVARYLYFGRIGDLEAYETHNVYDYVTIQGVMYLKYVWLTFVPFGLSIDHALFPRQFPEPLRYLSWSVIAVLTVGSAWALFKKRGGWQIAGAGWLLFFVAMLPTNSFFPTTDLFVERRSYFSTAGILLAVFALVPWVSRSRLWTRGALAAALAAVTFYSYVSYSRIEVFTSEETLWKEVLSKYPEDSRSRLNLSVYYLKRDDFASAKPILEQLIAEADYNFDAWANLGTVYHSTKSRFRDLAMAEKCYEKALSYEPTATETLANFGYLMVERQNHEKAKLLFERALAVSPRSPHLNLGAATAAFRRGDMAEARRYYEEALRWDPSYEPAQRGLASLPSN